MTPSGDEIQLTRSNARYWERKYGITTASYVNLVKCTKSVVDYDEYFKHVQQKDRVQSGESPVILVPGFEDPGTIMFI
jgi:hypothetical protein